MNTANAVIQVASRGVPLGAWTEDRIRSFRSLLSAAEAFDMSMGIASPVEHASLEFIRNQEERLKRVRDSQPVGMH